MLRASSLSRRWHSIDLLNTGNLSPSGSQLLLYLCFLFIKLSYSENIIRHSIDPVDNSVVRSWAKNQSSGGKVSGKAARHVARLIGLLGSEEALAQAIASSLYSRTLEDLPALLWGAKSLALGVAQWGERPPLTERLFTGWCQLSSSISRCSGTAIWSS